MSAFTAIYLIHLYNPLDPSTGTVIRFASYYWKHTRGYLSPAEILNLSHHQNVPHLESPSLDNITMHLWLLTLYVAFLLSRAYCLPCYGSKEGYIRRPNSPKIKEELIEYWSQPEVLVRMPDQMRYKVIEYIKQNREFRWVPTARNIARMMRERQEEEEIRQQDGKIYPGYPRPPSSSSSEDKI